MPVVPRIAFPKKKILLNADDVGMVRVSPRDLLP